MKYTMKKLIATIAVVFVVIAGLNASLVKKSETISSSGIEVDDDFKYISVSHENVAGEWNMKNLATREYWKNQYVQTMKKRVGCITDTLGI